MKIRSSVQTKEEYYGIYTKGEIEKEIAAQNILRLKAKRPVLVGKDCLLKVNLNVGMSDLEQKSSEIEKIQNICSLPYRPDSIMDLSLIESNEPLWKSILDEFDGAVGVIPYYTLFDEVSGINKRALMDRIVDLLRGGVSFMTLHPTADLGLYESAVKGNRMIPTTSRGGYVLLRDQIINSRKENIIASEFETIMRLFKEYGAAVSIGSVFRPATIWEALDEFHKKEIALQKKYIDIARRFGVPVMMEGVGHISLDKMDEYANLIRPLNAPLMPLGPMPSDEIIGFDHISNALGAMSLARLGVVGMINSVTREEHTGKIPSNDSVIEGLKTAKAVVHCYNISRFERYKAATEVIGLTRAKKESCVQQGGIFNAVFLNDSGDSGCSRCKHECPLKKIIV